VVANAGIFPEGRVSELTGAAVDEVFATNVRGTILIVHAAIGALERSAHGRVIVISSITGPLTGVPGWSHYGASKAAQLGFVRSAALELASQRITVNAVLPGNISTGDGEEDERQRREQVPAIPLGRLGEPEEVGYACLYLASDEARYLTGQTIVLDGGQTLPETFGDVQPPA
jgi:3-oxoacyl-[acyl-carrier protein] reductase